MTTPIKDFEVFSKGVGIMRSTMLVSIVALAFAAATTQAQAPSDGIFTPMSNPFPLNAGAVANDTKTGDPVFPVNGDVRIQKTDYSVPSVGFPFTMTRCYRSGTTYDGPLGKKWDFSFNTHIEKVGSDLNLYDGAAQFYTYTGDDSTYYACSGRYDKITYASSVYTRTTQHGFRFVYELCTGSSTQWRLSSLKDTNDNTSTLTYDLASYSGKLTKVTDTNARVYTFSYNSYNRITKLTDFGATPRKIGYYYNTSDELTKVTDLAFDGESLERSTLYAYVSAGSYVNLVATITDPKEAAKTTPTPFCRNYYSSSDGKCIVQEYGPDASSSENPPPGSHAFLWNYQTSKTDFTDRNGTVIRFSFDGSGRCTHKEWRNGGTPYPAVAYAYDANHNLTLITKNNGDKLAYTYDSNGNLLTAKSMDTNGSNALQTTYEHTGAWNQLTKTTDPQGVITTYAYDSTHGNLTSTVMDVGSSPHLNLTSTFHYASSAPYQMDSSTDPKGIKASYFYDTKNYLTKIAADTDTGGINLTVAEFAYDEFGNVTSIKDAKALQTTLTVNRLNQVTKITAPSPLSYTTDFIYDPSDNVLTTYVQSSAGSGSSGFVVKHEYDILDNCLKTTEDITSSTTRETNYAYDIDDKLTRVTAPEGNQVDYRYDEFDRNTAIVYGYGASNAATYKYFYDGNFRMTKREDPLGSSYATTYAFDHHDRMTKATNALGHYAKSDYGTDALVDSVSSYASGDALLSQVKTYYDTANRLTKTEALAKDEAGTDIGDGWVTSKVEYDLNGNVTKRKDENDHESLYTFDTLNRLSIAEDAIGNKTTYTYDSNGNVLTLKQEEKLDGGSTFDTYVYKFEFDNLNRATKSYDPTSATSTITYDPRGNVITSEDPNTHKVFLEYDELNRPTQVAVQRSATANIVKQTFYDKNGRITKSRDSNTNDTTFEYDALDRETKETYADTYSVLFTYDANSNILTREDQNTTKTFYTYDVLNRLTGKTFSKIAGHIAGELTAVAFTYDAMSRLTEATDTDSRVKYKYNTLSQVEEEEEQYGTTNKSAGNGRKIYWDYDDQGRMTALRYPGATSTSGQLNYTYDRLNRLTQVRRQTGTSTQEDITKWEFKGPSRVTKKTYGNGTYCEVAYDSRKRITDIDHRRSGSSMIVEFKYVYDAAGKVTGEGIQHYKNDGTTPLEDKGFNYAYDKAYRLTKLYRGVAWSQIGNTTPTTYDHKLDYDFDDQGNRKTVTKTPNGGSAAEDRYTTNTTNAYTAVDWAGTSESYAFDKAGNRTNWNSVLGYKYDYQNHLIEVTDLNGDDPTPHANYDHDALGRRIGKRFWYNGITLDFEAEKRFYYAGAALIQEYDHSGTDGSIANETLEMQYFWGQSLAEPCQEKHYTGGTLDLTAYYHQNQYASVYAISNTTNGSPLVETYRYKEYGEVTCYSGDSTSASEPVGNRWMWHCRYYDTEVTNLVSGVALYANKAAYDPELGESISRSIGDGTGMLRSPDGCSPSDDREYNSGDSRSVGADLGVVMAMESPSVSRFGLGRSRPKGDGPEWVYLCVPIYGWNYYAFAGKCEGVGTLGRRWEVVGSAFARVLAASTIPSDVSLPPGSCALGLPKSGLAAIAPTQSPGDVEVFVDVLVPILELVECDASVGFMLNQPYLCGNAYSHETLYGEDDGELQSSQEEGGSWILALGTLVAEAFGLTIAAVAVSTSSWIPTELKLMALTSIAALAIKWLEPATAALVHSVGCLQNPGEFTLHDGSKIPRSQWNETTWGYVHAFNGAQLGSRFGTAIARFVGFMWEVAECAAFAFTHNGSIAGWIAESQWDLMYYNEIGIGLSTMYPRGALSSMSTVTVMTKVAEQFANPWAKLKWLKMVLKFGPPI